MSGVDAPGPDDALDAVLGTLDGVRQQGGYWMARCPAHEDRSPSLSIKRGTAQPVILKCHAGCDPRDIVAALGLDWGDLCAPREKSTRTLTATYRYTSLDGELLFEKQRWEPGRDGRKKDFVIRRPDGRDGWVYREALKGVPRVLYRLPEVDAAIRTGQTVYVAEGEKDADRVVRAGAVATCNFDGAAAAGQRTKVRPEYATMLAAADVIVIADDDGPGLAHAAAWARELSGRARRVRVVKPARGKDLSDHLDAGLTLDDLVPVAQAPEAAGDAPHPADDPAVAGQADGQWEAPMPLATQAAPLPAPPLDALPGWLRDMVAATAAFYETPAEVPLLAALGALSAATGGRLWADARGQRVAVNFYGLAALDSGHRKSGPFGRLLTDPLIAAEKWLQKDEDAAAQSQQREPRRIRMFTSEPTPEGVRDLAAANGERVTIASSEGGVFETLAGRYSNGHPDLSFVLHAWNGEPYRADRASREMPPMNAPVATFALTTQRAVLRQLAANAAFRERGFLARIVFLIAPDIIGSRKNERIAIPKDTASTYDACISALFRLMHASGAGDGETWPLSQEAYKIFHDAEQVIEPKLARGAEYGGDDGMREWASKYTAHLLKIAGLLHAASVAEENAVMAALGGGTYFAVPEISELTMRNAIRLCDYFIAQAEAVFGYMRADPSAEGAQEILSWLSRLPRGQGTTRREVCKNVRRFKDDPDGAMPALWLLEKHGWIGVTQGSRRSWLIACHPDLSALSALRDYRGVSAAQGAETCADKPVGTLSAGVGTSVVVPTPADVVPTGLSAVQHPVSPAETPKKHRSADNADRSGVPAPADTVSDTHSSAPSWEGAKVWADDSWVRDAPDALPDVANVTPDDSLGHWPDDSPGATANPRQRQQPNRTTRAQRHSKGSANSPGKATCTGCGWKFPARYPDCPNCKQLKNPVE